MKKVTFILIISFIPFIIHAQKTKIEDNVNFNGYIQTRAGSDFNNYINFSIRRLKIWIKSKPSFSKHWSYKIQTTFTNLRQEKFFLQDVKIRYKTNLLSFDIGQFVPQYSLQRFQPDYTLPLTERARAINTLIPNGTIGVRDIGLQTNFYSKNKLFETHFGVFNGYGIKEYRINNNGFMLTHKTAINILSQKNKLKFGYSLQYRKADNLQMHRILEDHVLYSGNDLRYNIFTRFENKYFALQGEYLTANLKNQQANGWYILSTVNFKKNQIVFSYEEYHDLIFSTNDTPYFHLAYNYLFNKNKIKLYFDNTFQIIDNKITDKITFIQLQIFFK